MVGMVVLAPKLIPSSALAPQGKNKPLPISNSEESFFE